MKYLLISTLFISTLIVSSCKKTQNCECKTTWTTYDMFGQHNHEETYAYTLKGTKSDNKTECDAIKTNLTSENQDGYYTTCEIKK